MSITFPHRFSVPLIGGAAGLLLGCLAMFRVHLERWPARLEPLATAMLLLAPVLGLLFAREAAGPRAANGLRAALWISVVGVPAGAFLTAAVAAVGVIEDFGDFVQATLGIGFVGLIILGIPAMLPAMMIALVWVAIVRVTVRVLRVA